MARSSSRKRTSVFKPNQSQSKPASSSPSARPAPVQPTTASTGNTFGDAVKSGIGMGVGIEAVRSVAGMMRSSDDTQKETSASHHPCVQTHNELMKCLNEKSFDCYDLLNNYNLCLKKYNL